MSLSLVLFFAFAVLPLYVSSGLAGMGVLAPLVLLPIAVRLDRTVATRTDGPALNAALAETARLGLLYCLLFSLGFFFR